MDLLLQFFGLAYFLFALWNLRLAVLMLPLFFPAYLLKFDVAGLPFPLVEVFVDATFLAWIFRTGWDFFHKKITWKQLLEPYKHTWWLAVLGIVIAAVISTIIAPQAVTMLDGTTIYYGRKIAMGILKSWILCPVLMLILFAWIMRTGKDMTIALNCYVVSAVFLAAWGAYQVLTGQYITPDARASGPFNSANYLALYITPALFYALARLKDFFVVHEQSMLTRFFQFFKRNSNDLQRRRNFLLAVLWSAGFFLLLFGLLFTKSYAAFLAFFVACFLWLAMHVKNWKRFPWKTILIIAGVIVVVVIALIALDPTKWQLFFQLTTRTSSGVRVEVYTIATRLVLEHPLLGIGLGMFPAVYQIEGPRILGQALYELNMLHPHDIFLAFWLNLGLLGFLSFLWIIKICFQKGWKHLKAVWQNRAPDLSWFKGVGLLMFIIILVHGTVDTPFFKNDLALLFWLVVSMIVFPASQKDKQ